MHDQWQDLIPFYIAGTLSAYERAALEQHLAQCDVCRTAASEWALIADAVRSEADAWARPLPPLSKGVRQDVLNSKSARNGSIGRTLPPPSQYPPIYQRPPVTPFPRRRTWVPATLVAMLAAVLVFGGLLVMMAARQNPAATPDFAGPGTGVARLSQEPDRSSPLPLVTNTPRGGGDLGILPVNTPTPLSTPSPAPSSPPSAEPPVAALQSSSATATTGPYTAPLPDRCTVTPATGSPVLIYRWPHVEQTNGQINPGEYYISWVYTEDGWYQVGRPGGGLGGWVRSSEVMLNGPCDQMMLPSATPSVSPHETCLVGSTSADRLVSIYAGPGRGYQILNAISQYNTAEAIARSDNGWYRVRFSVPPQTIVIGWVAAEDAGADVYGALCSQLPMLSSANYPPEIPLPTGGTPVAQFDRYIGMSQYDVMTTENIGGAIPANTRVRISQARYDGTQWWYVVVTQDEQRSAEAREAQLTFAPGVTPNAPTPTSALPTATYTPTPCKPVFYFSEQHRAICSLPAQQASVQAAYQPYQNGFMLWRQDTGDVWVFSGSSVLKYAEAAYGPLPDNPVTDAPPQGMVRPISGFGRVWGNFENVRSLVGWATAPEQGYTMTVQFTAAPVITNYFYMTLPDSRVVKVFDDLTWAFETPASALAGG